MTEKNKQSASLTVPNVSNYRMVKIEIYTSSATGLLKVKKDQTSLKFLLDKKKVTYTGT